MSKNHDLLLKRADYEFQDSQLRLKESNSLIKTSLGFFGAIASFLFYTKVYDAIFLISGISIVFGMIWLEDQVKMHRKMHTKKSILKELLGKKYKKYKIKYRRSPLDAISYLLSGYITFVGFGTLPSIAYSMLFLFKPDMVSFILERAVNPFLITSYVFNLLNIILLIVFLIYFSDVTIRLALDKKNVTEISSIHKFLKRVVHFLRNC